MTTPTNFKIGSYGINSGLSTRIEWQNSDGLFNPVNVEEGSTFRTMGEENRIYSLPTAYQRRKFRLTVQQRKYSGLAEGWSVQATGWEGMGGTVSRIEAGSLFLNATLSSPQEIDPKGHSSFARYVIDGTAVPPLWSGLYQQVVGTSNGLYIADDRPNNTLYTVTIAAGTANAQASLSIGGDAPCALVLSFTAANYLSSLVYVRVTAPNYNKHIVVSTDSAGNGYVTADLKLMVPSGTVVVRFEDVTGALLNGAIAGSFAGTVFRHIGGDSSRFADGPVITPFRTGVANYLSATATISQAVDGQPRIGMPYGTYSAANAGFLVECAAVNILASSNVSTGTDTSADTTGWRNNDGGVILGAGGAISTTTAEHFQGSRALKCDVTGTFQGCATNNNSVAASTVYSVSCWVKVTAAQSMGLRMRDGTGVTIMDLTFVGTGAWQYVSGSGTTSGGATTMYLAWFTRNGTNVSFYIDSVQAEANPFPTSWVDGTRNADYAIVTLPSNLLKYSESFDQWTVGATAQAVVANASIGPSGVTSADTLQWNSTLGTADYRYDASSAVNGAIGGTTFVFSVWLKASSSSSVALSILNQASTSRVNSNLTITTSWARYFVTIAMNAADIGIIARLSANASTGTILAWGAQLEVGSVPGQYVYTSGTAVQLPSGAVPHFGTNWMQNGYIAVTAVLPAISTGLFTGIFGDFAGLDAVLYRQTAPTTGQNYLTIRRKGNGSNFYSLADINVGNVWDGAPHIFILAWYNYTLAGVQHMYLRLFVDGTQKSGDIDQATSSFTSWSVMERFFLCAPGPVVLGCNATLSNLSCGFPGDGRNSTVTALPTGAIVSS